jgi:prepilin-type N-terminal cleavage/methylation domain-containing protein
MRKTHNQGFTLIEMVIYIALFSLMMTGILLSAYQLIAGSGMTEASVTTQEEGNFVLRKMSWALTGTSSLAQITTLTHGAYAGALALTRADGTTVDMCLKDQTIWMRENQTGGTCADGSYASTTTSNVRVTSLQFLYQSAPAGIVASTTINGTVFTITKYIRQ